MASKIDKILKNHNTYGVTNTAAEPWKVQGLTESQKKIIANHNKVNGTNQSKSYGTNTTATPWSPTSVYSLNNQQYVNQAMNVAQTAEQRRQRAYAQLQAMALQKQLPKVTTPTATQNVAPSYTPSNKITNDMLGYTAPGLTPEQHNAQIFTKIKNLESQKTAAYDLMNKAQIDNDNDKVDELKSYLLKLDQDIIDLNASMKSENETPVATKSPYTPYQQMMSADDYNKQADSRIANLEQQRDYALKEMTLAGELQDEPRRKIFADYINTVDSEIKSIKATYKYNNYKDDPDSAIKIATVPDTNKTKGLSSEEIAQYKYIYATQGKDVAENYLEQTMPVANKRNALTAIQLVQEEAEQNPIFGAFGTVGFDMASGFNFGLAQLKKGITGKEIDPYDPALLNTRLADASREGMKTGAKDKLGIEADSTGGKIADFAIDTGISMVESAIRAFMGSFTSPVLGSLQAGLSAGAGAYTDARDKGVDDKTATIRGISQGAAEGFFEKFSLENLIKAGVPANGREALLNTAKQAFTEGSEEFFTEASNMITDDFILKDQSDLQQMYNRLIDEENMSPEEAYTEVLKQTAKQVGMAFAGGFVSGGLMGGGNQLRMTAETNQAYKGYGQMSDIDANTVQAIKQNLDTDKTHYDNKEDYAKVKRLDNLLDDATKVYEKGNELNDRQKGALEIAIDDVANIEGNKQSAYLNNLNLFGKIDNNIQSNIQREGAYYDKSSNRERWQDNLGGQGGSSEVSAETQEGINRRREAVASIRSEAEANGWERVDGATFDKDGTTNKTAYKVSDDWIESNDSDLARELKTLKAEAAKSGQKLSFVVGALEMTDQFGDTYDVRGISMGKDGMVVRVDSDTATATQIYKHEEYHQMKQFNPNLVKDTKQNFLNTHTQEELDNILYSYADAYGFLSYDENGNFDQKAFDAKADYVLEEIFADSYAGIIDDEAGIVKGVKKSAKREMRRTKKNNSSEIETAANELKKESAVKALSKAEDIGKTRTETKTEAKAEAKTLAKAETKTDNKTEYETKKNIQMDNAVEQTKDLLAIHNITPSLLNDALGRDGLIMPSVAVTNKGFDQFGDISLLFRKDTIDPSMNDLNKLYGSDAWTPTQTTLKKNAQFDTAKVDDTLGSIKENLGDNADLFPYSTKEFENKVRDNDGSVYKAFAHDQGMQTAYALEKDLIDEIPLNDDGTVNKAELQDMLDEKLDNDDSWRVYKKWLGNISDEVITSHDTASNEDIMRDMKSQPESAKRFKLSLSGELTAPVTQYDTIDTARSNKSRLKEDVTAETKAVADKMLKWADKVSEDADRSKKTVVNAINETFDSRYNTEDIKSAFADKGIDISDSQAQSLQDMYKEAVELPTQYFEGKPGRTVAFDEIDTAVVPDNTSAELKKALESKGIKVVEYKAGDKQSRLEAMRSRKDIMFSRENKIESVDEVKTALKNGTSAEKITKALAPDELYTKSDIKANQNSYSREMDEKLMKKSFKYNKRQDATYGHADPKALEEVAKLRTDVKVELDKLTDLLPVDIAGQTMKDNSSYGKTIENSLVCPRSLVSAYFLDTISEKLGRPLNINEQIVACQILADATGMQKECTYCYVKNDRAKYRDFFNTYYDSYIDTVNKAKANKKGYQESIKQGKGKNNTLYHEFLNGRKNTDNMWNRYVAFAKDGISGKNSISLNDLATAGTRHEASKNSSKAFLVNDAEAYCRSSAWPVNTERVVKKNGKEMFLEYVAYNGSILNMKPDMVETLNSSFGLRMYSYSDYTPHNILENIQMVTDASIRGLKMLAYTKDVRFAKVFAKTGMGINISVFGEVDKKTGKMVADEMMGANWKEAQAIRKANPNVGVVFVATTKDSITWALDQEWIDVVIPTHTVRTGAEVFKEFGYTDFKGQQEDAKTANWDEKSGNLKSIPPTIHANSRSEYLKALKENNLTPRFSEYLTNPNYMKLVNETRMAYTDLQPVQPIFDRTEVMAEVDRIKKEGAYGLVEGIKDKETQDELLTDYADKAVKEIGNTNGKRFSKESPQDRKVRVAFGSMFSGAGTMDFALRNMISNRFAVEYDGQIAGVFKDNNGDDIYVGDVRDAIKDGYIKNKDIDYLHASPVCKNYSLQKVGAEELPIDIKTAKAVADAINGNTPKVVTIENVKGYRNSEAIKLIKKALTDNGYKYDEDVYRASDYGGSTIRERYFLRAVKDVDTMPSKPQTKEGKSWYEVTKDLIPDLKEMPYKEGGYLKERWDSMKSSIDTSEPVLLLYGTKGGKIAYAEASDYSPTVIAHTTEARIAMPDGRLLEVTPRVLARIQGLPDSFKLPTQKTLASKVVGNGVPVQLSQAIAGSLMTQIDGVDKVKFSKEVDSSGNKLSTNQQKYFAESKVRDEDGKLLTVYHGSPSTDITKFDKGKAGEHTQAYNDKALWFTTDKQFADDFSYEMLPGNSNLTYKRGAKGKVYEGYLDMKNPFDFNNLTDGMKDMLFENAKEMGFYDDKTKFLKEVDKLVEVGNHQMLKTYLDYDKLEKNGYDGVIARLDTKVNGNDNLEYGVFNSNQFKNIDNQNPTSNDDTRFSRELTPEQLKNAKLRYTADEMNWQIGKTKGIEREKAAMRLKKAKEDTREKTTAKLKTEEQMKLDKQKAKYEQRLADEKQNKRDAVEREREAKHKAIANERAKQNEKMLKQREMKAEARTRQKLLAAVQDAIRAAKNNPGLAAQQIRTLVDGIDNKAVKLLPTTREQIQAKENEIMKLAANDPDFNRLHKDRMLASVRRLYQTQIYDMDIDEVKTLTEDLVSLTHHIENENKLIRDKQKREVSVEAEAWTNELNNNVKPLNKSSAISKTISDYSLNNLNPLRAMRRISGYTRNSVGESMVREVYNGKTKETELKRRFLQPFDDFVQNKANLDFVKTASQQNIPITSKGKTYYISKGMRVALYLHSLNSDNLTHIAKGGINIPNAKLYQKGDISNAYGNDIVHLTPTEIDDIVSYMTPSEREYATLMQSFFREAADAINDTSIDLDGLLKAQVENYFPITSDSDYLASAVDFLNDPTVEGWNNLKERVEGANTPILLEDATKVLERHINKTAQYAGLAIPLRNFQKVFNYTKASKDNIRVVGNDMYTNYMKDDTKEALIFSSVQKAMKNAWDAETVKYVQSFLRDVNSGGRKFERAELEKLRSAYASATLTLNPSVALKQTTSYFMAGSILSNSSLAYGLTHKFTKADERYMDSITPWGWNRRIGQSTIELGDMAKKQGLTSKIPNWNQAMDVITTNALFVATERDIQKQYPNLKRGDAEYDNALAEKYNEVLWRTQPQYDVAFRPEYLRRTDIGSRTFGMFKTESMQMAGELMDAYGQYKADKRNGLDTTESRKTFYKTLGSWTTSNLAFAAMGAALKFALHNIKGFRDDEGEIDPNAVLKEILSGFVSSSAGGFFYGSQINDAISYVRKLAKGDQAQWYDIEVPGMSIVNDLVESSGNLVTTIGKDDVTAKDITKAVSRFALDVSKLTPVGFAENVYKMADAVNLYIQDISNGKLGKYESGENLLNLKDTSVTSKQYATRTVNAFADGNDERGKKAWNELVSQVGFDKAEDKVRTILGEEFKDMYDAKIAEGLSQTNAYEYALENGLTLANDIIANSQDENIRDIAIKKVYDLKKDNAQKPSTAEVIESLDISNADKGRVYSESTDSKKLRTWRDNGGSEYDYYVATQMIAPDIPKEDEDGNDVDSILYVMDKVESGEITQSQASAWLESAKSDTKAYEYWADADGSNQEFFEAYSAIKEIKAKKLKDESKKSQVVKLINQYMKTSDDPESTARAMWTMAGYDFDSTKNKKKVEDGNFFASFKQFKTNTAKKKTTVKKTTVNPKYLSKGKETTTTEKPKQLSSKGKYSFTLEDNRK